MHDSIVKCTAKGMEIHNFYLLYGINVHISHKGQNNFITKQNVSIIALLLHKYLKQYVQNLETSMVYDI